MGIALSPSSKQPSDQKKKKAKIEICRDDDDDKNIKPHIRTDLLKRRK